MNAHIIPPVWMQVRNVLGHAQTTRKSFSGKPKPHMMSMYKSINISSLQPSPYCVRYTYTSNFYNLWCTNVGVRVISVSAIFDTSNTSGGNSNSVIGSSQTGPSSLSSNLGTSTSSRSTSTSSPSSSSGN